MTPPYSEDTLVERPAITLFGQLGWETANCFDVVFGDDGSTTTTRQLVEGGCCKNAITASRMRDGEKSLSTHGRRVCPQYTP